MYRMPFSTTYRRKYRTPDVEHESTADVAGDWSHMVSDHGEHRAGSSTPGDRTQHRETPPLSPLRLPACCAGTSFFSTSILYGRETSSPPGVCTTWLTLHHVLSTAWPAASPCVRCYAAVSLHAPDATWLPPPSLYGEFKRPNHRGVGRVTRGVGRAPMTISQR